jgi:hypothetical protein
MTKGVSKKLQRDDQRRKKRAQTATGFAQAAKTPPKAIPIAQRRSRPTDGRATAAHEPLPAHSYPTKRVSLGKRQAPGGSPA